MKPYPRVLRAAAAAAALAFTVVAAVAAEKKVAGPNGGRVITKVDPRAEFFVRPDRTVQITFLDPAGRPIAPAEQSVIATAGERSAPRTLTFAKSGQVLVSNAPLPDGEAVPTVVQIRPAPGAKVAIEKFNVDLSTCGECRHAEYACICDH